MAGKSWLDTVMNDKEIIRILSSFDTLKRHKVYVLHKDRAIAKAQAEISFRAGREEASK